jgi:hypothetical protein
MITVIRGKAAVGRTYLQGGDNSGEGRLSVTTTRNLETAQPEESEGSSSEGSGPSSEGSGSLPGMHGLFLKQSARELEMVTTVKGGVKQGRQPSWSFTGRLIVPASCHEWQNPMSCALKWEEHASRMRLIQSSNEADIQNVELQTWFVMESRGGEDWLRELGDQDEVTYVIAARVPACSLWNLLDCRDEDGGPLMKASIHSSQIAGRSGLDAGGDDKGASVGRWLTIVIAEMYGSWRAPPEAFDRARRSAYNDRQLLMEFRSQSQKLQDQVRSNLITLTRQAYDDRKTYDLSMKTSKHDEIQGPLGRIR